MADSDQTSETNPLAGDPGERADKVRACIAEALAIELDEVSLGSNLMEELGADSLSYLDIVFRLEQEFDIQITRGEMERAARGDMSEDDFAPGGVISEAGLARLRELMPESAERIGPGLRPAEILSLFTTRTFLNMVEGKLRGESA
ncbi:acyl carrier protein [Haliangium sp.]|uniref:acyl carrier protein n=1 Tax=Haliangium sp. TaxID=2663208 RepID=UPI003D0E94C8